MKRSLLAFVLSIIAPGLGHIYDGRPIAGILLATALISFVCLSGWLGLLHSFHSAVAYISIGCIFQVTVAAHAAVIAIRQVKTNSFPGPRRSSYALGALVLALFAITGFTSREILGVRAYKITSNSMSPTLIVGDRFFVDLTYYKTHKPRPGDVIAFQSPTNNVVLIKRIVGVAGDVVESGSEGTFVNGKMLSGPIPQRENYSRSDPVTIPSAQLFVMGDNQPYSYDSRHFGPVDTSRVIGKALYIYYSASDVARVGRRIE